MIKTQAQDPGPFPSHMYTLALSYQDRSSQQHILPCQGLSLRYMLVSNGFGHLPSTGRADATVPYMVKKPTDRGPMRQIFSDEVLI